MLSSGFMWKVALSLLNMIIRSITEGCYIHCCCTPDGQMVVSGFSKSSQNTVIVNSSFRKEL